MNRRRIFFSILVLSLAVISCNLQSGPSTQSPDQAQQATSIESATGVQTVQATNTSVSTEIPATLAPSATPCSPQVTANSAVNVRKGPGTVYDIVGALTEGSTAGIAGKSTDGTWWYIDFPAGDGGHAWVSSSVVSSFCVPASVALIAAPPTPVPASGTCMDGYVYRLIKASDKTCVTPASKAQAQADNAAAASRKATATYGPDTCIEGYVWRDAFTNDHVCVTAAVRSQAASDNSAAASRWTSGIDHTCLSGFVWREARAGDDVCVTPDVRSQAAADNAAAASRKVTSTYGPDTCATGFVWRDAFTNDHVCVTPAVHDQVAADNAAAPSHTWP